MKNSLPAVNKERLTSAFLDLVKIPSPSWREHEVINYIQKRMESLGLKVTLFECGLSYNLLAVLEGDPELEPVLFSAHTDTVTPCENIKPVVTASKIRSDGTTILGADDKSAIAMFIEAVEIIKENNIKTGTLEFLLTCAEEIGLQGIKGFDTGVLKSKRAFVFDSGGPVGRIITAAPYHYKINIMIKGRAAHAGLEPEKGISAISVLAKIAADLPSGRVDSETTINLGSISGGIANNIVAPEADCGLEVRSIDKKKAMSLINVVKDKVKKRCAEAGASGKTEVNLEYPGFAIGASHPALKAAEAALLRISIKPELMIAGGGSDTNVLNSRGIRAINLSCGMRGVHSVSEHIMIKDLVNGARLALSIAAGN
jgi:tripeptide aminopeptidase